MNAVILFISGVEIFVVILVVLVLFGAKKIPEIARGLGKGLTEFQKATNEIKKEFKEQTGDFVDDAKQIKENIQNAANDITKGIKNNFKNE